MRNSHVQVIRHSTDQPLRINRNLTVVESQLAKFRDIGTLQKFAAIHASIHNHFHQDRHLNHRNGFKRKRSVALAEWRQLAA